MIKRKILWEADNPVPATTNINKAIKDIQGLITKSKSVYERAIQDLNARFDAKMSDLTTTTGELGGQVEQLSKKVQELQSDFENKSAQVDSMIEKIRSVMPSLSGDGMEMLDQITGELKELRSQLDAKKEEAAGLGEELSGARQKGREMYQDMVDLIHELEAFGKEAQDKISQAEKDIKGLREKQRSFVKDVPTGEFKDHTQYGEFNLMEHLEKTRHQKRHWSDW